MMKRKILFIDRDGTLIKEPPDKQVDALEKISLLKNVIPALAKLKQAGFMLVMVSNQDGLGSSAFPYGDFELTQNFMLSLFESQGVKFDDIKICPHFEEALCECRKPRVGLLLDYITKEQIDYRQSYVIGDRDSDMVLAKKVGIWGIRVKPETDWLDIANQILNCDRKAEVNRDTNETKIQALLNLDDNRLINIKTGLGFFDHMLEQLVKHAGVSLLLECKGDLCIDEHHTVEDTALVLGQAFKKALGDKVGVGRYGFCVPMDESLSQVAIDLSGRPTCIFKATFNRQMINDLSTEMVEHFFQSLAISLGCAIHIQCEGQNVHHMIESIFKAVGRSLRMAITKVDNDLPSTKGVL